MGRLTEILNAAHERAEDLGLMYEGALLPEEAWEILQLAPGSKLVDVRSRAELELVGSIPGALHIEYKSFPGWMVNESFANQLNQEVSHESLVMFICRSGARSDNAAMIAMNEGFPDCYNVLEGFEGDADDAGHRGLVNGWKAKKLPWIQG